MTTPGKEYHHNSIKKKKKILVLSYLVCTVPLGSCRYSRPWYRNPDTDFEDRVHFGLYWDSRPWFWLSSEDRISVKQSWCCNLGWWWHLWLFSEPSKGSVYCSRFGQNYFHSEKITHGVEGDHNYCWGRLRSFLAIRCFIVCIIYCIFKIFEVSGVKGLIFFSEWCMRSAVQRYFSRCSTRRKRGKYLDF